MIYLNFSGGSKVGTLLPAAPQAVKDLNEGTVALLVNVAAIAVVTLVARKPRLIEAATT